MPFWLTTRARDGFGAIALNRRSVRETRGRRATGKTLLATSLAVLLLDACAAPSDDGLYDPLVGRGGRAASSAGVGGGAAGASAGSNAFGGASSSEGQGGSSIAFAGSGGVMGEASVISGESSDAGVADAAVEDGGPTADAAVEPPACVPDVEICDGLDNDCDSEVDPGATCDATCTGFALDGRGYMFCSVGVSRAGAVTRCAAEGMRLVWVETPEESEALVASIAAADLPTLPGNAEVLFHIGASDAGGEGEWSWVGNGVVEDGPQFWEGAHAGLGGEPVGGEYSAWSNLEPNDANPAGEDCAIMSVLGSPAREPGQWDDRNCTITFPFACEVP
jgi:hypothetical protein